jgi:hypothetical protein
MDVAIAFHTLDQEARRLAAETPIVGYQTPTEDFLAVLEMHPGLALTLLKVIAGSLIEGGLRPA